MDLRFSHFEILTGSSVLILCLLLICVAVEADGIESELARHARIAVSGEGLYWVSATPSGQKITLTGSATNHAARERAAAYVAAVPGVTRVQNDIAIIGETGTCQQEFDTLLADEQLNFRSGRSEISESSFPLLHLLATIARGCGAGIEIAGHTDSSGNRAINMVLSQRRAEEVRRHLVSSGVAPRQVKAVGYGETQPLADNTMEEGRRANRRIEFRVIGVQA